MPSCWKLAWCFCSDPGRRPKISSPVHLLLKVNDDRNNNNNPKGVGAFSRCAVATLIASRFSRATTHVNNENQEVIEGSFCATIIFIICAHFSPGISSTQSRALIAVYVQVCSPHYYFFFSNIKVWGRDSRAWSSGSSVNWANTRSSHGCFSFRYRTQYFISYNEAVPLAKQRVVTQSVRGIWRCRAGDDEVKRRQDSLFIL